MKMKMSTAPIAVNRLTQTMAANLQSEMACFGEDTDAVLQQKINWHLPDVLRAQEIATKLATFMSEEVAINLLLLVRISDTVINYNYVDDPEDEYLIY